MKREKTINRVTLAHAVATREGLSESDCRIVLDAMLKEIGETLILGQPVKLTGLGGWKVVQQAARQGRDVRAGKSLVIPATRRIKFKASIGVAAQIAGPPSSLGGSTRSEVRSGDDPKPLSCFNSAPV